MWGQVSEDDVQGRPPPTQRQAQPDWHYSQVIKHRSKYHLTGISIKVVNGDTEDVLDLLGGHTAYVERTNLTSHQMNGQLVRKMMSFSK